MNIELKNKITSENILALNKKLGYDTFYNTKGGINVNIGVVRSKNRDSGTFDDIEFVMYQVKDLLWNIDYYSVTADPSRETLLTLPNKFGAAIIVPGQYKQCWKLGFHNGKSDHPALVQIRPINVIRDFNKDTKLDADIITDKNKYIFNTTTTQFGSITYVVEKSTNKTVQIINKGLFGINNHRASKYQLLTWIGAYSQGCMVHNDYKRYMELFIPTLKKSASTYGDEFTITVYTEEQFNSL